MNKHHQIFEAFDAPNVGIDKLNISTKEFLVPDANRLNIDYYGRKAGQPAAIQEGLFHTTDGEIIEGRKAHYNGNGYGLNISSYGLNIVMSPAKVLHPNKPFILPSDEQQIYDAAKAIEQRIKADTGIILSYDAANVCRLDLAKQMQMPRRVADYSPAFNAFKLKGTRQQKRTYGEQTFTYNSSSSPHQFSFYDKAVEYLQTLTNKDLPADLQRLSYGSDYLRAELRLLDTKYIRKATNTDANFENVLNAGFGTFAGIYDRYLDTKIFSAFHQASLHFDTDQIRQRFENEISKGNRKRVAHRVIASIGKEFIFNEIGLDKFLSVAEIYLDRTNVWRIRKEITKAGTEYQPTNTISTIQLINELKQAFAA